MINIRIDGDTKKVFKLNQYFNDYGLEEVKIAKKFQSRTFYLKDIL